MADVYGANLYNRSLQTQAEVNISATATDNQNEVHPGERKGNSISVSSAESCQSILVCTGVYRPQGDMPANWSETMAETVFHGHRDFHFDPSLVKASHIVRDVNDAVDLVFQKEDWKPE